MWKVGAIVLLACATAAADPVGRWSMNLDVHYWANPTTEQLIEHDIVGAAWFELAADGTVTGCMGRKSHDASAQGHYEAADHKDHSQIYDYRLLLALRGTWTASGTGFDLSITGSSGNSCTLAVATSDPQLALHCSAVGSAVRAPAGTVVCTSATGGDIDGLGITLVAPSGAMLRSQNPSGSSLLLGRTPGVLVVSSQRDHERPKLAISAGATSLYEPVFAEPAKPVKRR
jgi:hypothetical protein